MPNNSSIEFEGAHFSVSVLPADVFVPAGGQGIVAMQVRADDAPSRTLVEAINDARTGLCLLAEREFLRLLHGDCNQPVGVFASLDGNVMRLCGQLFEPGANTPRATTIEGSADRAEQLAAELLRRIQL
jgi:hydroxymethylbilane synthase